MKKGIEIIILASLAYSLINIPIKEVTVLSEIILGAYCLGLCFAAFMRFSRKELVDIVLMWAQVLVPYAVGSSGLCKDVGIYLVGIAVSIVILIRAIIFWSKRSLEKKHAAEQARIYNEQVRLRNEHSMMLRQMANQIDANVNNYLSRMEVINNQLRNSDYEYMFIKASSRNAYVEKWAIKFGKLCSEIEQIKNSYDYPYNKRVNGYKAEDKQLAVFMDVAESVIAEDKGIKIGEAGEKRICEVFNKYGNRYTYITNICLKNPYDDKGTAEFDNILITDKAIFVIEVKNRGVDKDNWTLKISKDGLWKVQKGKTETQWKSPVDQNIRHKIFLEEELKKLFDCERLPFEIMPIIVFANDDIIIENESNNVVIRTSELINYVETYRSDSYISNEEKERILDFLKINDVYFSKTVRVRKYEKEYELGVQILNIEKELSEYCIEAGEEYGQAYYKFN